MSEELENIIEEGENSPSPELLAQEQEAKQLGWVPKEDFNGDPDQWRPADAYLKRGKEINGFLRKDLEKIRAAHATEIAELRGTLEEFKTFHNSSLADAKKKVIEELKAAKVEAIEQGDGARVVELDDQIEKVKEAAKPVQQTQPEPKENKEYYSWLKDNQWYITKRNIFGDAAEEYGHLIHAENPNLKGIDFLNEVTERMKEGFPDLFENPARKDNKTSNSSDGRSPGGKTKKHTYENLPEEAKKACDRFTKQKLMTQEQYLSEYQWE